MHPDVDLGVIATPNASHAPLAEAALRAGKHVVVDKPFTVTLEEARALCALAQASSRFQGGDRGRTLPACSRGAPATVPADSLSRTRLVRNA